jgi:glycine oxidase ThiO
VSASSPTCDVAVVGGGVIGLACAWRLRQHGMSVALFERGALGQEASHAAAGMLAAQCEAAVHPPHPSVRVRSSEQFFHSCLASRALYPSWARELLQATGVDIELSHANSPSRDWREPGILFVETRKESDEEAAAARGRFDQQADRQPSAFTNSRGDEFPSVWLPQEGQVENRLLVRALVHACRSGGVQIHEKAPLLSWQLEAGRVMRLTAGERDWTPGQVLVCAGAWSAEVQGGAALGLVARPLFGQVLCLQEPEKGEDRRLRRLLYSPNVYIVPRRDGRVLVGATMEERGFDRTSTARGVQQLLNAALSLEPALGEMALCEHWSGVRPASPDGLPIIGRTPLSNVWGATGHGRNGILLAPFTAKAVASALAGGPEPPASFSPLRFLEP